MNTKYLLIILSLILIIIFVVVNILPFEIQNIPTKSIKNNASEIKYPIPDSPYYNNLTVHFIDVGQGDSVLIKYANKTMLIDAGEKNRGIDVSVYLKSQNVSTLNYVVGTHPHADHIGGLLTILNKYPVKNFIDSGYPHTSNTYQNILKKIDKKNITYHVAQRDEFVDFDKNITIEILNPTKDTTEEINDNSAVLKITYNKVSFLLMGDAGIPIENELLEKKYNINADFLKVAHHGGVSSSGSKFIKAVSPTVSIIEVGENNDYGHPHKEVLKILRNVSKIYRTDYDGNIIVTTDGKNYTVIAQNK